MARSAVIVDILRSPFARGRADAALSGLHPVDLYAQVLAGLTARNDIDPALIEDVITGCVIQVGEQSGNIGRQAVLAAGLPETTPAVTLDRKCGSAQQAMDFAAQGVIAGAYDAVIAGGVEMMSVAPMRSNRLGKDNIGLALRGRYPKGFVHQGVSAELIAAHWNLSREDLDAYALRSHQLAAAAEDQGVFSRSLLPVAIENREGVQCVDSDEGIRRDTTLDKLSALKPAFYDPDIARLYPDISWRVTAGNSSQVSDGATAALIMEESVAARLGLSPMARVTHFAVVGDDPVMMLTGVIPATRKILARAGLKISDIDIFEVNEAFASVVLAWGKEFEPDPEKVNVFGGAIAVGHPVGASGGRLMANLIAALDKTGGRLGLQTMCESGGMANATLVQRL